MPVPKSGLHVRVVSRRVVKASDTSMEPHVITFSNLDLIDDVQMYTVCVYPRPPTGDFNAVTAAFEARLPSFLNYFAPLAGRVVTSPTSGLPELHCHNQGAELVVANAAAGVELLDIDWSLPDKSVKRIALPYAEDVPLSLQLVSFSCGGFAVVWAMHHIIGDGSFAAMVISKWSEVVRSGGTISGPLPCHDRSVIPRPRDPPSYGASVDGMLARWEPDHLVNALTAEASFTRRLYYVDGSDIARLRETASASRAEALSAYLWKVLAGVVRTSSKAQDRCRMVLYVDGRRRLSSPEPLRNYTGNVISYAMGDASVDTIVGKSLEDVAAIVRDAITGPDYDELFQDMVDWVQLHKPGRFFEPLTVGLGSPTLSVTTWASYPLDTDFGFGHAMLAVPLDEEGRNCSGHLYVTSCPGEPASWIIYAYIWPRLAAALESDDQCVFKPLTADYLGLTHARAKPHF